MVLELLHVLFVLGLFVELLPGFPGQSEEHNLQALENMRLVRAENFQLSSDLHPRRPH